METNEMATHICCVSETGEKMFEKIPAGFSKDIFSSQEIDTIIGARKHMVIDGTVGFLYLDTDRKTILSILLEAPSNEEKMRADKRMVSAYITSVELYEGLMSSVSC